VDASGFETDETCILSCILGKMLVLVN